MEAFLDFIRAAAPWVAAGLSIAVLAARAAAGKKKGEASDGDYGTEGMCLGMCFGLLIGTALENSTGLGVSLGMLIGLTIGTHISKKADVENK